MECPNCRQPLNPDGQVCPRCGRELNVSEIFRNLQKSLDGFQDRVRRRLEALKNLCAGAEQYVGEEVADLQRRLNALGPMLDGSRPTEPEAAPPDSVVATPAVEEEAPSPPPSPAPPLPPPPPPAPLPKAVVPPPMAEVPEPVTVSRKSAESGTEVKLGQKVLLVVGIVLTIVGIGFFLKYAFDRQWIPPVGRVALAYLAGFALLAVGEMFRRRGLRAFGLHLLGGGIAALYFSGFAAFQIYELIGQVPAFGLMGAVTALAGVLALRHDSMWLAVLGIIGGFLTPVVLSTGTDHQVALMTYMMILNAGILGIAAFKRWNLLNYLGFAFTWFLFTGWFIEHYDHIALTNFWTTTVFVNLFFLTYAIVPYLYYFARETDHRVSGYVITVPNTLLALAYSFFTIREFAGREYVSLATLPYAALFFAMAAYLYRRDREQTPPVTLLMSKGALFLIITVPLVFSDHAWTASWAVQAAVLMWAAARTGNRALCVGAVALAAATCGKFFLYDYAQVFGFNWMSYFFTGGYATLLLERVVTSVMVLGTLLALSFLAAKARGELKAALAGEATGSLLACFVAVLFAILNIEVVAFFYDHVPGIRAAPLSVLWALLGIGLLAVGVRLGRSWPLAAGAVLALAATAKLLFCDYWADFDLNVEVFDLGAPYAETLVWRILTVVACLSALAVARRLPQPAAADEMPVAAALRRVHIPTLTVTLFIVLNVEVAAFFHQHFPTARFASISVLWALFSIVLMVVGFVRNRALLRRCSLGLFAVTVAKVFLVDMANVETPFKIISFIVLGVLLIVASYFYHRYKDRILPQTDPEST